jgi:TIR domain
MNVSRSVKTILILTANPNNISDRAFAQEVREIEQGLNRSMYREKFKLEQKWAVQTKDIRRAMLDIRRAMLDIRPNIIHFSGCGAGAEGLVFEDEGGNPKMVSGKALGQLFKSFVEDLECVVLNACYSKIQAEDIQKYIPGVKVVGMSAAIGTKAAIQYALGFYDGLGAGKSIDFAHELGENAIYLDGIVEDNAPILITTNEENSARQKENISIVSMLLTTSLKIFVSYSDKDKDLKEKLISSLSPLERDNLVEIWSSTDILPGSVRDNEIRRKQEDADLIFLLISPDFIQSDSHYQLLTQVSSKDRVAILLRPTSLAEDNFPQLKFLPMNKKAVTLWHNIDEAFYDIGNSIRSICEKLKLQNRIKEDLLADKFKELAEKAMDEFISSKSR